MIVLGTDTHKRSHTVAAVAAGTGELLGEQTVAVGGRGFDAMLQWARGLDDDRVWALEDCRHVSGSLERFLIERGERVLRIPTHLTAKARKSARQRGKSDPIDALNVARAAVQEGLQSFPTAHLVGRSGGRWAGARPAARWGPWWGGQAVAGVVVCRQSLSRLWAAFVSRHSDLAAALP